MLILFTKSIKKGVYEKQARFSIMIKEIKEK